MRKEFFILSFILVLTPTLLALTGEAITGHEAQQPTNVSVFVLPSFPIIDILSPENKVYYDTKILLNYSIKNELTNAWYNLDNSVNISLPTLSDYFAYINVPLGDHVLYLYANNSRGISINNVSFTSAQEPPSTSSSSSSSSSGGGGGGSISGGVSSSTFDVSAQLLEVSLFPGETKKETITLVNNINSDMQINVELTSLGDFALLDEKSFILTSGKTKNFDLNFFSLNNAPAGLYFGKITFNAGQMKKIVNVILEVKEKEALFDININVLPSDKISSPGNKISLIINMTNVGFNNQSVDVGLSLKLTDLDNKVLYESIKETLAVQKEVSITRKLQIPSAIPEGIYVVVGEITYNNLSAISHDTIKINPQQSGLNIILVSLILIATAIFFILRYKKNIKKVFEKMFS